MVRADKIAKDYIRRTHRLVRRHGYAIVEYGDILLTFAEVSVAFAGFSGVVAVFGRRDPASWSFPDRVRFFALVQGSLSALLLCIVPFGLLAFEASEEIVWRCSSTLFVFVVIATLAFTARHLRNASTSDRAGITWIALYLILAILAPIFVLNVHNIVGTARFGPFLAGLIFLLAYSSFLFARMLISSFVRRAA